MELTSLLMNNHAEYIIDPKASQFTVHAFAGSGLLWKPKA
jgi:hypothetical protein